tara:strand:+ start:208 stop:1329 length:1122 start_codon:yes stop_codon:yes gene_type:complete
MNLDKIKACLILGSYLDTLGFNNGYWEFNFYKKISNLRDAMLVQNEIINHYYSLGGPCINISSWNASDDTIMMIATKIACDKNATINNFKEQYLKILSTLKDKKRASGYTTIKSLEKLKNNKKINYENIMGGNGAAMRTAYIGIKFHKPFQIDELIETSIASSRLTHNYPLAFLGGLVTALFTSYAINDINPFSWAKNLMELEKSGKIDNYMKQTNIYEKYKKDKNEFFQFWSKYIEQRLDRIQIRPREFLFSGDRYKDLLNYTPGVILGSKNVDFSKFASTGVGATIVAYDSLLMSIISVTDIEKIDNIFSLKNYNKLNFNWNNLIFFSTLHFGDNDSTGIIAGNWFGALRGFKDIENKNRILNELEFKKFL